MQTLKFELTPDEYNFVRSVLGDLPTKSNAWVFLNKLENQAVAQAKPVQEQADSAPAPAVK
jgi:hypothetical protein